MLYINQNDWHPYEYHYLGIRSAISEYIKRSGAYVGPPDPFGEDDFDNPKYYLPEVSEEVKTALGEAEKILLIAHIYQTRFEKLRSGEDDEEDFLRLLEKQLDEAKFTLCPSCGIRDYPDKLTTCRYCGSLME